MDAPYWQPLFGPDSLLSSSQQVVKCWAQLDTATLDRIRLVGYLYRPNTGATDSAATCDFRIYRVRDINIPQWDDLYLSTVSGTVQSNGYFFADVLLSTITGAQLDGDTTLMIECTLTRSGSTFRDRVYLNHLGVYDSVIRLQKAVDFLDITKQDE